MRTNSTFDFVQDLTDTLNKVNKITNYWRHCEHVALEITEDIHLVADDIMFQD